MGNGGQSHEVEQRAAEGKEQRQSYAVTLSEARARGDEAIARKIEQRIQDLEQFQQRHPDETNAPSPLDVFCDLNPSNSDCLVYDD